MESFFFAYEALVPLLLVAVVGYLLRRVGLVGEAFVQQLNRYVFYIALPVLIFTTLTDMEDFRLVDGGVVAFAVIAILFVVAVGIFYVRLAPLRGVERPIILQALFRGNFVLIGFPLAERLGGFEALQVLVILNAAMIPLANFGSIVVFRLYDGSTTTREVLWRLLKSTAGNPIMIGVFAGLLAFLVGFPAGLPQGVAVLPDALDYISRTATPMALVAVGAQFRMERTRTMLRPIIHGVASRLVVVPLVVFLVALAIERPLGLDFTPAWPALIALFASPVAVSSVAVTQELGGEEELASQIVIWSTALAVLTIFTFVVFFRSTGLL